jgi:hypothetical protein
MICVKNTITMSTRENKKTVEEGKNVRNKKEGKSKPGNASSKKGKTVNKPKINTDVDQE